MIDSDDTVFEQLYPRLLAYASVVADPGVDADDLIQDALVATLRSHRLVDLDHPQAYLRRAILTAAMAQQRRSRTLRRLVPKLGDRLTVVPDYPSDLGDLDHLEPRDRAILYLVHVEGCSYDEVEELTAENAQNARLRASRARARLRDSIAAETRNDHDGNGPEKTR